MVHRVSRARRLRGAGIRGFAAALPAGTAALAVLLVSGPASAQVRGDRFGVAAAPVGGAAFLDAAVAAATAGSTDPVPAAPVPLQVTGGLFAGAGGGLVGLLAGLAAGSLRGPDDLEGLDWAGYGVASGAALAAPVGVHAADRGRGSLPLALLAGGGVAAIAVTGLRNDVPAGAAVLTGLVGSTLVAVVVEHVTAR